MKRVPAAAAVVLAVSLAGCSGCDSDGALIIHLLDARLCGGLAPVMVDFTAEDQGVLVWSAELPGTLDDGFKLKYQFEFRDNHVNLTGTIDLHAGEQSNYSTCGVCVRAFAFDSNDQIVKTYFQSAGSVTLSENPFTNKHMIASFTGLELDQVTIDDQTHVSTSVPGGACASFVTFNLDQDRVPNAWTCMHTEWDSGTNCNCMCGIPDPDCLINNAPVVGCTSGQACFLDRCVTPPNNDTCVTATALTIGTPDNGTTVGAGRNYDLGLEGTTCIGSPQPGSDVVYSVALMQNQPITVTLSNPAADFDGSIALLGPDASGICDASPITTCVAGADDGFVGGNETLMYTAPTVGTYFIIVDSFAPTTAGTFTLTVTSP